MSNVSLIDGHIDGEDKEPLSDNSQEVKEKVVILSLQPKWCELIASGRKTVEVRKSKPKLELPFKVFIYQTKQSWVYNVYNEIADSQGKIIGEFLCTGFDEFTPTRIGIAFKRFSALYETCLSLREILQYANGKKVFGWRISDLKIYDKPKELGEFKIQRAPQSWCYAIEFHE